MAIFIMLFLALILSLDDVETQNNVFKIFEIH